jgi:hypothetical protein
VSEPSASDVTASPAEQQTVEQQLQPEGQAVAQRPSEAARPPEEQAVEQEQQPEGQAVAQRPSEEARPPEEQAVEQEQQPEGQAVGQRPSEEAPSREEQAVESDPSSSAAGTEPAAGGPPPPKDPVQEQIKRLESQYQGKRTAKDSADSEFADIEGRLKAFRKLQADIDKVVQAYKAARDQLSIDQRDYDDYRDSEKESLGAQLQPETVDKIKKATDEKKDRDNALAKARDESKSKLTTALDARDKAADVRKEKDAAVTAAMQWTATIAARHAKLKSMSADVTKAHQAGQYALAYWLLVHRDYDTELQAASRWLIKPEELPAKLLAAVDALAKAEKDLADAETAAANARTDLAAAEKALADQNANGEANLRKKLEDMTPSNA